MRITPAMMRELEFMQRQERAGVISYYSTHQRQVVDALLRRELVRTEAPYGITRLKLTDEGRQLLK